MVGIFLQVPVTDTFAWVDDVDSDICDIKWSFSRRTGYAYCGSKSNKSAMHRVVLSRVLGRPLSRSEQVDHINGDRLDNRRENLRLATCSQNQMNKGSRSGSSSQYKGISWHKRQRRWIAEIRKDRRKLVIGSFVDEELAARAYDMFARRMHGEFARLNFPDCDSHVPSELFRRKKYSKYVGVSLVIRDGVWLAQIRVSGKLHRLGTFDNEIEAARAYDKASLAVRGAKARLNFPGEI